MHIFICAIKMNFVPQDKKINKQDMCAHVNLRVSLFICKNSKEEASKFLHKPKGKKLASLCTQRPYEYIYAFACAVIRRNKLASFSEGLIA